MYKFKPSKAKVREFALKMQEIEEFCYQNNIDTSYSKDSYYFEINNQKYRVSNHAVEKRNYVRDIYNPTEFVKANFKKYDDKREKDTIYIHASKTRIIEIYNNLKNGLVLDGKGNVITKTKTNKSNKMQKQNSELNQMQADYIVIDENFNEEKKNNFKTKTQKPKEFKKVVKYQDKKHQEEKEQEMELI